tara:strand:+ start:528 stop:764 length:237 start_codon:yes stop_codon:yes gene_type:complete
MPARNANAVVRHLSDDHIAPRQEAVRNVTAALAQLDDLSSAAKTRILNALTTDMGEISGCSECTAMLSDGVALTSGDE